MNRNFVVALVGMASLVSLGLTQSARAADTTLNFEGLGLSDYGAISQTYGSAAVNTPDVSVAFRTFNTGNDATYTNYVDLWTTGYGDLQNVAFASGNGYGFEMALTPTAGHTVTLKSFDMAGWYQADRLASLLRIVDGSGNVLLDYGTPTVHGSGPTHDSFSPDLTSSGTIKLQFGTDWNIGIDNIVFAQDLTTAPTPEPGTVALLVASGLGSVALLRRRRK